MAKTFRRLLNNLTFCCAGRNKTTIDESEYFNIKTVDKKTSKEQPTKTRHPQITAFDLNNPFIIPEIEVINSLIKDLYEEKEKELVSNSRIPAIYKQINIKMVELIDLTSDNMEFLLNIYKTANTVGARRAFRSAAKALALHFNNLVADKSFLNLSLNQLTTILRQEKIAIKSEIDLFQAAVYWINQDYSTRQHLAIDLFRFINFSALTMPELMQCYSYQPNLFQSSEVDIILRNAATYISLKYLNKELTVFAFAPNPREFTIRPETSNPFEPVNPFD
ncbi:hypothetical protein JTE90_005010 [Oedothorax gibbosus]|uniref:BACK domain-containing protein n=1 Tax=Oedothorax gibbosus TaxID=931172 RepID=A0AAV6VCF2_9ARAC|nr:hypothetical protein JTE90_005010 [Oedothorax gibbosus]